MGDVFMCFTSFHEVACPRTPNKDHQKLLQVCVCVYFTELWKSRVHILLWVTEGILLCSGTVVDTLQTPDDSIPPVKFRGVWEIYRVIIISPNPGQWLQGLIINGAGDGKKTEVLCKSQKIHALTSNHSEFGCMIHYFGSINLWGEKQR